jgi:hypothetical protein
MNKKILGKLIQDINFKRTALLRKIILKTLQIF